VPLEGSKTTLEHRQPRKTSGEGPLVLREKVEKPEMDGPGGPKKNRLSRSTRERDQTRQPCFGRKTSTPIPRVDGSGVKKERPQAFSGNCRHSLTKKGDKAREIVGNLGLKMTAKPLLLLG